MRRRLLHAAEIEQGLRRALTDGELLPVAGGLRVVHTPGHSPGHISLLLESTRTLITGDALDLIRAGNTERMVGGVPQSREFRTGEAFAGAHRERQIGVAKQLFAR